MRRTASMRKKRLQPRRDRRSERRYSSLFAMHAYIHTLHAACMHACMRILPEVIAAAKTLLRSKDRSLLRGAPFSSQHNIKHTHTTQTNTRTCMHAFTQTDILRLLFVLGFGQLRQCWAAAAEFCAFLGKCCLISSSVCRLTYLFVSHLMLYGMSTR